MGSTRARPRAEAERLYGESIEMRRELYGDHPSLARALTSLGRYRIDRGEPSAAEPLIREAVEMLHRLYPEGGILTSRAQSDLGACLTALGRHEEAEALLLSSVSALGEETGRALALRRLVSLYEAWARPGEADRYRASGTDQ